MSAADRARGWNWTYWNDVQRPLLEELSDPDHHRALLAPHAQLTITANAPDIALSARTANGILYLIAVRKNPTANGRIHFNGLPAGTNDGTVLAHLGGNPARPVTVTHGGFTDPSPFAPHNARVYRFPG